MFLTPRRAAWCSLWWSSGWHFQVYHSPTNTYRYIVKKILQFLHAYISFVKCVKYESNVFFFLQWFGKHENWSFLGIFQNFKNSLYPFYVASNVLLQAEMHQPIFCCQYIEKIILKWVKFKFTFVSAIWSAKHSAEHDDHFGDHWKMLIKTRKLPNGFWC